MKVAVIGSRSIYVSDIGSHLPAGCTEIVSGGARGVDTCAANYAKDMGLKLTEFLPDYSLWGKRAPLVRNKEIVNYADYVVAFWDGESRGTWFVLNYCKEIGKPYRIVYMQ